jgi:hypothetical protein
MIPEDQEQKTVIIAEFGRRWVRFTSMYRRMIRPKFSNALRILAAAGANALARECGSTRRPPAWRYWFP